MTRARLTRELKRCAIAWSILCAVGATAGGIVGWVAWEADRDV